MKKILLLTLVSIVVPVRLRITDDINLSKKHNLIKIEESSYKIETFGTDIPLQHNSTIELLLNEKEKATKSYKFKYFGTVHSDILMFLLSEIIDAGDKNKEIKVGIFGTLIPYKESKKD